jgi:type III pantothenate kinase
MSQTTYPFVAVDIGNSRLKFGLYEAPSEANAPVPDRTLDFDPEKDAHERIAAWLAPWNVEQASWWIASVNRSHTTLLVDWLRGGQADVKITLLASEDLPLRVSLPRPDMVGIDRLAGAVAVNRLRDSQRAAVVVDLGTAITVDLIDAEGAFLGGAILPGIGLSARALYEFTDLLPLLDMRVLREPPPALGKSTTDAMQSGLYWGAVGGVRELIARLASDQAADAQVFLTGGAAPSVAGLLAPDALYVPHLVLAGIAITAAACVERVP